MNLTSLRNIPNWAFLMRPNSPGDTFRLLHGLKVKFGTAAIAMICNKQSLKTYNGLWSSEQSSRYVFESCQVCVEGNLYWISPNVLGDATNGEFSAESVAKAGSAIWSRTTRPAVVWTTCSNHRIPKAVGTSLGLSMQRIDKKKNCKEFSNQLLEVPVIYRGVERKRHRLAVVLRNSGIHDWRYSPPYHYDPRIFNDVDVDVWYAGLSTMGEYHRAFAANNIPIKLIKGRCLPFVGKSILEQIELAMDFDFAVGVNSAAMDVFAAAGCLVVREAVFQGLNGAKNAWYGGWDYNRFLGIGPNIELRIAQRHYDNRDQAQYYGEWHSKRRFLAAVKAAVQSTKQYGYLAGVGECQFKGFSHGKTGEPARIRKWLRSVSG